MLQTSERKTGSALRGKNIAPCLAGSLLISPETSLNIALSSRRVSKMHSCRKFAALVIAALALPMTAGAATIGGTFYATQYDFQDFWTASDGKNFRVVLVGNPFPAIATDEA